MRAHCASCKKWGAGAPGDPPVPPPFDVVLCAIEMRSAIVLQEYARLQHLVYAIAHEKRPAKSCNRINAAIKSNKTCILFYFILLLVWFNVQQIQPVILLLHLFCMIAHETTPL